LMITLRPIARDDLPFVYHLKGQAGWNQTEADLRRFLRLQADGCFVAAWEDRPAGTVAVFLFDSVAWVAMLLVEASLRGRGLGRTLMEHALQFAEERGARTVRLDATLLGQPLYERLGFVPDYELARFGGEPRPLEATRELSHVTVKQVAALDLAATCTPRQRLLESFWDEQPGWGVVGDQRALGYYAARPGSLATQIGPCIGDATTGPILLSDAFRRYAGQPVVVDIPTINQPACQVAQAAGLTPQRRLLRMTLGDRVNERTEMLWASSGPEKG
jgi:GNAT superfamily N-acetyltransferase